jgi:hypothetical protein
VTLGTYTDRDARGSRVSDKNGGVDVTIEGSTMHVGNRMYNIGNLVGTSIDAYNIGFDGGPVKAVWLEKWRLLAIAVGLYALASYGGSAGIGSGTISLLEGILILAAVVVIVQIVRKLRKRATGYILQLETSGAVTGVLASRDPGAIRGLAKLVADATNNPPANAIHTYVNQGTIINQRGDRNIGQQMNR